MSDMRRWHLDPLELTVGMPEINAMMREKNQASWDAVKGMDIVGLDREDYGKASLFFDHESNDWAYGMMEGALAMKKSMQASYERGMIARNSANDRYDAEMMKLGRKEGQFKEGTLLHIDADTEEFIQQWAETNEWNVLAMTEGLDKTPFAEWWYDTPDDLLNAPSPDGWSPSEAVKQLKEDAPDNYSRYALALGGEDALAEVVKDARNAPEFFWKLNNQVQTIAMGRAIQHFDETGGKWEKLSKKTWNFIANGILNDPDMIASLTIGAALNVVTAGTMGTALIVGKLANTANSLRKANLAIDSISKIGGVQRKAQGAINWLPENIGPHILNKTLFKNSNTMGLPRFFMNRTADAAEGFISGGLAETWSQARQLEYGKRDAMSVSDIYREAKLEAVLSPLINPAMGFFMRFPAQAARYITDEGLTKVGRNFVGDEIYELIQRSFRDKIGGDQFAAALKQTARLRDNNARLTGRKFSNSDSVENRHMLDTMTVLHQQYAQQQHAGQDEQAFEDRFIEIQEGIINDLDPEVTLSDMELADRIIDKYGELYGFADKAVIADMKKSLFMNIQIENARTRYNKTNNTSLDYDQYVNHIEESGEYLDIMGPEVEQQTKEHWSKLNPEGEWDKLDPADKVKAAVDYQADLEAANRERIKEHREVVKGLRQANVDALDKAAIILEEETRTERERKAESKRRSDARRRERETLEEEAEKVNESLNDDTLSEEERAEKQEHLDKINAALEAHDKVAAEEEAAEAPPEIPVEDVTTAEELFQVLEEAKSVRAEDRMQWLKDNGAVVFSHVMESGTVDPATGGTASETRAIIVFEINGVKIPYYRSFGGTSGKKKGAFHPFFGLSVESYGNFEWVIKGTVDKDTGKMKGGSDNFNALTKLVNEMWADVPHNQEKEFGWNDLQHDPANPHGGPISKDGTIHSKRFPKHIMDVIYSDEQVASWSSDIEFSRYSGNAPIMSKNSPWVNDFIEQQLNEINEALDKTEAPLSGDEAPLLGDEAETPDDGVTDSSEAPTVITIEDENKKLSKKLEERKKDLKKRIDEAVENGEPTLDIESEVNEIEETLAELHETLGAFKEAEVADIIKAGGDPKILEINKELADLVERRAKINEEYERVNETYLRYSTATSYVILTVLTAGRTYEAEMEAKPVTRSEWRTYGKKLKKEGVKGLNGNSSTEALEAHWEANVQRETVTEADSLYERLTDDEKKTVDDLIEALEWGLTRVKSKSKEATRYKRAIELLNKYKTEGSLNNSQQAAIKRTVRDSDEKFKSISDLVEKEIADSEPAAEYRENEKEIHEKRKIISSMRTKLWLNEVKNKRGMFFTIQTLRQTVTERRAILNALKKRRETFDTYMKEAKASKRNKHSFQQIRSLIPPTSTLWAYVLKDARLNPDKYKKKTYTTDEVTRMYNDAETEVRRYAKRIKAGYLRHMPLTGDSATALNSVLTTEVDEDYVMELTRTDEELLDSTPRLIEVKSRDLASEAEALDQWLLQIEGHEVSHPDGEIPYFLLNSIMPEYFDTMGIHLGIIFNSALVETGEVTRDMDPLSMLKLSDRIKFDLEAVKKILNVAALRSKIGLGHWTNQLVDAGISQQIDMLSKEGSSNSHYGLMVTEKVLRKLEDAQRPLNKRLFAQHGYILKKDADGLPVLHEHLRGTTKKASRNKWEREVYVNIIHRLESFLEDKFNGKKLIAKLKEQYPDWYNYDTDPEVLLVEIKDTLPNKIIDNVDTLVPGEKFELHHLGDGTIDWQSADEVGAALFDYVLDKDMVVKNPLVGLDPEVSFSEEISEFHINENEAVTTVVPSQGQTNRMAPTTPRDLFRVFENYRHRTRVRAILNAEFRTEKEKQEIWDFIDSQTTDFAVDEDGNIIENPVATGQRVRFGLLPEVIGGSLHDRVRTLDDLKQFHTDHLLNLPNIAATHIHDEFTGSVDDRVELADGTNLYLSDISAGSAFTVPFGHVGETLAIETMWTGFEGLTDAQIMVVDHVIKQQKKKGVKGEDLFTKRHYKDRSFSGLMELKLLAMAGRAEMNEDGTMFKSAELIDKLVQQIIDGTIADNFKPNDIDYYQSAGLFVADQLSDAVENRGRNTLARFNKVFSVLRKDDGSYMTQEEWAALARELTEKGEARTEEETDLLNKLDALRAMFKIPVMRRLYQGGFNSFKTEFIKDGGDGKAALKKVEEVFGEEFTADEVHDFGMFMFKQSAHVIGIALENQLEKELSGVVIDAGLGIPKGTKGAALDFLRLDTTGGGSVGMESQRYLKNVIAWSEGGKTELDDKHPLKQAEHHESQWDAALNDLTNKEYGIKEVVGEEQWDENRKRVEEKYAPRLDEARHFLGVKPDPKRFPDRKSLTREQVEAMKPGSEHHDEYMTILYGGDQAMYKSLGYFKAVNSANRTAHKLDVNRMKAMSEYLGFMDFDEGDFMGLENFIIYMTNLPSTASFRNYNKASGYGYNTQGVFWERVAKNPDLVDPTKKDNLFEEYARSRGIIKDGDVFTLDTLSMEQRQIALAQVMSDKDSRDAMGMFNVESNTYYGMDGAEFDQVIEELMIKEMLLQYATHNKPPMKSYTAEDVEGELEQEAMMKWYTHTRKRSRTIKQEMELEQKWLDYSKGVPKKIADETGAQPQDFATLLELRAKAGRIVNPQVAMELGKSVDLFTRREFDDDPDRVLSINTNSLSGPLSFQPKYKKVSYHDRGIFFLQRGKINRQLREVFTPLTAARDATRPGTDMYNVFKNNPELAYFGSEQTSPAFGYEQPWTRGSLPVAPPLSSDWLANITDDGAVGKRARQMLRNLQMWAQKRGMLTLVEQNPEALPYFFNLMRLDTLNTKIRRRIKRLERKLSDDAAIAQERMNWLIQLHQLTYLSRDIKNAEVRQLSLTNPARRISTTRGFKQESLDGITWRELFLSVANEGNPDGILLDQTLMQEQIEYGIVPKEGILLYEGSARKPEPGEDNFAMTDLHLISSTIQGHDLNKFILSALYQEYITKIILNDPKLKKYKKVAKDPNSWELDISLKDKKYIIQKVKVMADRDGGLNIDLALSAEFERTVSTKDGEEMVQLNAVLGDSKVVRKNDGTEVDTSWGLRNALSKVGFGMLVQAPRVVKGKKYRLALTMDSSMLMFALLENQTDLATMNLSALLNKNMGTRLSAQGEIVRALTDSEFADQSFGFNMDDMNRETVYDSEALEMIARSHDENVGLTKVEDRQSKIDGVKTEVIDLDMYTMPPENIDMAHIAIETHIGPIESFLQRVNHNNLGSINAEVRDVIESIRALIDDVRKSPDSVELRAELIYLSTMIETGSPTISTAMDKVFVDRNMFPETYSPSMRETILESRKLMARSKFTTIAQLGNRKHAYYANPYSTFAEETMWDLNRYEKQRIEKGEEIDTDISLKDRFIKTVIEKNVNSEWFENQDREFTQEMKEQLADQAWELATHEYTINRAAEEVSYYGELDERSPDIPKVSRSSNAFNEWAEEQPDIITKDLQRINESINAMEEQNILDAHGSKVVRAMILRMVAYNPMNVKNLNFDSMSLQSGINGYAMRNEEGKFFIDIDKKLRRKNAVLVIAHELAHIGTFRFLDIQSPEYNTWLNMYNNPKGEKWLRKMVVAWQGGTSTESTEEMVRYYMSEPKEFMAAFVQFHLLNEAGAITIDESWTADDAAVHEAATGIMSRILHHVSRLFGKLNSVFSNFQQEDPVFYKHMTRMSERALGWDSDAQATIMQVGFNRKFREANHGETSPIFESIDTEKQDAKLSVLTKKLRQVVSQKELAESDGDTDAMSRLQREEQRLQADIVANDYTTELGLSRAEYYKEIEGVHSRWDFRKPDGTMTGYIDIDRMMESDTRGGRDAQVALQYIFDNLRKVYGDPVTANAAAAGSKMLGKLSQRLTGNKRTLQNALVDLTIGNTGASKTWLGGTIFQQLFSVILDDTVVQTANGTSRLQGMPSVQRVLQELNIMSDTMHGYNKAIKKIVKSPEDARKVHTAILLATEDSTNYNLPEGLTQRQLDDLQVIIKDASKTLKNYMDNLLKTGNEVGLFGDKFESRIPYRMNQNYNSHGDAGVNFRTGMYKNINERIANHGGNASVDGITLYAAGILPDISTEQAMLKELNDLYADPDTRGIVVHLIVEAQNKIRGTEIKEHDKPAIVKEQLALMADSSTAPGEKGSQARLLIRQEVVKLMNQMQRGQITWNTLKANNMVTPNGTVKARYEEAAIAKGNDVGHRLRGLQVTGIGISDNIYFMGSERGAGVKGEFEGGIQSVADLHYYNFINKATTGLYFPNNNWVIPKVSEISTDSKMMESIMVDPKFIIGQFKKSVGDRILEAKMMRDNFQIHGNYGSLLGLARFVMKETANLSHPDGTTLSEPEKRALREGLDLLETKWNHTRGIIEGVTATDSVTKTFFDVAPGLTKMAYSANLLLATVTVEGNFNALTELFGRKSLTGFIRGYTSLLPRGKTTRRRVAAELVGQIEAITSGRIPDFETPSAAIKKNRIVQGINHLGNLGMKASAYAIEGMAVSRAISLRKAITNNFRTGRLEALSKILQDSKIETDKELLGAMRKSKIPKEDFRIIKYMIEAGLFVSATGEGNWHVLSDLFNRVEQGNAQGATFQNGYYSLSELLQYANTRLNATDASYPAVLETISKLRHIEKAFIEEVMISPNAFDVYTGSKPGNVGVFDSLVEIYRRYSVLFVSQKVIRAGGRMSPMAFGIQLMTLCLLDIMYMTLLRIANGAEPEELVEEFEEDPVQWAIHNITRLPLLGRYIPIISEMLKEAMKSRPGYATDLLIPFGAFTSIFKNLWGVVEGSTTGNITGEDLINATRFIPIVGDSLMRMAYHGIHDHANTGMRIAGKAPTSKVEFEATGGHFGIPSGYHNETPEAFGVSVIEACFGKMKPDVQNTPMFQNLAGMMTPPQGQPTAPEQPAQPVQPTPAETPEARPLDVIEQIAAQDSPSSELADRLGRGDY